MEYVSDQHFAYLKGAYVGQPDDQPVFLGITALSGSLEDKRQGDFYIGFDNRFQPALVRIFYQPPSNLYGDARALGLVQFGEYRMQGMPLWPNRYSPEIDYKNLYYSPALIADDQFWIDIMDPAHAYERLRLGDRTPPVFPHNVLPPFFPYNALLTDRAVSWDACFKHGPANGSVLKMGEQFAGGDALAASLVAPVALDIDLLNEKAIRNQRDGYLRLHGKASVEGRASEAPPLFNVEFNQQTLGARDIVKFVLDQLNELLRQSGQTPLIDDSDVEWVKLIGDHLLIKLYDPEDLGPIYCVFGHDGRLVAYAFDDYQIYPHMTEANIYIFEQYKKHRQALRHFNAFVGVVEERPPGLAPIPFYDLGQEVVVSFRYLTVAYAASATDVWPITGIWWEVSRKFDFEQLEWGPLQFHRPQPFLPPFAHNIFALPKYYQWLGAETAPMLSPVENPSVWFQVPTVPIVNRAIYYGPHATTWLG